jgi:hypothetical protein
LVTLVDSGFQRAPGIHGWIFGVDDLDHPDAADSASVTANHDRNQDRNRPILWCSGANG